MRFKPILQSIGLCAAIGFSHSALAVTTPDSCPSVSTIKSVGVKNIINDPYHSNYYVAFTTHNFSTNNQWLFVVANVKAANNADALTRAKKALPSLAGTPAPIYESRSNIYACLYSIDSGFVAVAVTPIPPHTTAAVKNR